ncbi:MAG: chitobiase/beta-hexosaminidase C-terminal domain-containing protein [Leptospiraceae bacterium]|nr:chitobiase/beta-hexosaminidase C-terminal domain-containing protein [Leptospiraceae bacterium]MCZ8346665.1 chitobiase/beta-hexosaminidase C-terminal domain-containing protein [Leptospiraceae bacterium]
MSKRFYWIHIIYLFWGCIPFKEASLDSNSLLSNLVFLYRLQNVSTIRFDPPSGFYNAFQQIKISSSLQNVNIHYTIDGSDPTIDSPIYSSEISIWNLAGRNLRAVEFRGGVITGRITDSGIYKYNL